MYERLLRLTFIAAMYLGVCGLILAIFFLKPGVAVNSRATFLDMVHGSAHKPFVMRALVPFLVRTISDHSSPFVEKTICAVVFRLSPVEIERLVTGDKRALPFCYEYCVGALIIFLCFLGYAVCLYYLLREFYRFPDSFNIVAPIFGIMVLPLFFRYPNYIYDPSTLFLYTFSIFCIAKRFHTLYYIVLILAIFNKETAILLLGVYWVKEWPLVPRRVLLQQLTLQGLIFIAIRSSLWFFFRDNPGQGIEVHLDHNMTLATDFLSKTTIGVLSIAGFLGTLVAYQWTQKPLFLRKGLLITIVPLSGLTVFFGYLDELRDYYEALPFIFLLSAPTLVKIFGVGSSQDFPYDVMEQAAVDADDSMNRIVKSETEVALYRLSPTAHNGSITT